MTSCLDVSTLFGQAVQPRLFIDFDGTISEIDVIDAILAKFADGRWLETENEWVEGRIGSRECLRTQFSYLNVAPEDLTAYLDTLTIDRGFLSILDLCRRHSTGVHIISDGFGEYIRRLLDRHISDPVERALISVSANSLLYVGRGKWTTSFPYFDKVCSDGCATCKPAVMRLNCPRAAAAIFIGDGMSDRFAAEAADFVFAKSKLAELCIATNTAHVSYRKLDDVADQLRPFYETARAHASELPASLKEAFSQ